MYTDSALTRSLISLLVLAAAVAGCGVPLPKGMSTAQALTSSAEWLESEPLATRHELFREVARQSTAQVGRSGAVLFPLLVNGTFIGAPALSPGLDLLGAGDAGAAVLLSFDRTQPFAEDRRDAFQGLSEREAAEQIARSLMVQWRITPAGTVNVVRVDGAPYAAAYIEGELRLNPSFIYLAAVPPLTP